jgi:hypothetical protein
VEVLRRARSGGSVEIGVLALFILFNFVSILSSLYLQHLSYSATALSFHLLYFDLFYLFSFHAHFICILVSLHFSVNIRFCVTCAAPSCSSQCRAHDCATHLLYLVTAVQ